MEYEASSHFMDELDLLVRARYTALYVVTWEEGRLEQMLFELANKQGKRFCVWTSYRGLCEFRGAHDADQGDREFAAPTAVLSEIAHREEAALYLLKDFHVYLEDHRIARQLRDLAADLRDTYKTLLISAPRLELPPELDKDLTIVDLPLPSRADLLALLRSVCVELRRSDKKAVDLSQSHAEALVRAALGLTLSEAENAFAKAAVTGATLSRDDVDLVMSEKQQVIRKSGILEFYPADATLADVGGLVHLKQWLHRRGKAFDPAARGFGLSAPKGVLLIGVPGCGKSLTARAVAQVWQLPLLHLDLGRVFSGLLGSSEENMRRALAVAESVAPAVLWIDEIEKGLAGGGGSGQTDGGTANRVFGTLLTWMQERAGQVFVVATANRVDVLPPELIRRGRFDEIFFVDLPGEEVRREILSIHLAKRRRDPAKFDLGAVAARCHGFSGAELEHCVAEALFFAFDEGREVCEADVLRAASETTPLAVTSAEQLERLRDWAAARARPADPASQVKRARAASPLCAAELPFGEVAIEDFELD